MKNAINQGIKKIVLWMGMAVIGIIAVPIVILIGAINMVWSAVDFIIDKFFSR